ncbi:MAG: hypothetical protein WD042_00540 [Phycisphaeraceae bacterium]
MTFRNGGEQLTVRAVAGCSYQGTVKIDGKDIACQLLDLDATCSLSWREPNNTNASYTATLLLEYPVKVEHEPIQIGQVPSVEKPDQPTEARRDTP